MKAIEEKALKCYNNRKDDAMSNYKKNNDDILNIKKERIERLKQFISCNTFTFTISTLKEEKKKEYYKILKNIVLEKENMYLKIVKFLLLEVIFDNKNEKFCNLEAIEKKALYDFNAGLYDKIEHLIDYEEGFKSLKKVIELDINSIDQMDAMTESWFDVLGENMSFE